MSRGQALRRAALVMVLAAVMPVSGCAQDDSSASEESHRLPAAGRWSTEFGEAIAIASDYEAVVLRDGRITAAELADAQARNRSCMRDAGYDFRINNDDGTSSLSRVDGEDLPPDRVVDDVWRGCAHRFDRSITYLYREVRRNPEKQDDAKVTAACLRRSGIVDKGYTERQWRAENDTGHFSFDDYDPAAVQCRLDPLGLWRDG